MQEAVDAIVGDLEARLFELVERVRDRYALEERARSAHGMRSGGYVRADHVEGQEGA